MMMKNNISLYTPCEELLNSLTHGLGTLLGIIALGLMISISLEHASITYLVSSVIYGSSLIMLYLVSTLYHSFRTERLKKVFQILDHCAIYLLIAGTYTPIMLISLKGFWGYSLLIVVWVLAIFGIVFKLIFQSKYSRVSLATYLIMGWLCLLIGGQIIEKLPFGGLMFLVAGGLAYSFGTIFFVLDRIPYNHAIWHICVMAGSVCHFFAIYEYVLTVVPKV